MTNEEIAEVQRRECTLCLARYLEADPDAADPFSLFCTAWFAGLDAGRLPPRDLAEVDRELAMVRERTRRAKVDYLSITQEELCALLTPNPSHSSLSATKSKIPRLRPNF